MYSHSRISTWGQLEENNALKAELGLPSDMRAAQAIAAACEMMQMAAEEGESLTSLADRVVAAVGCEVAPGGLFS